MGRFHERFELQVNNDEAQTRFVNRVQNQIFDEFLNDESSGAWIHNKAIHRDVANAFGDQFESLMSLSFYIGNDFHKCLHALETIHGTLSRSDDDVKTRYLSFLINQILAASEIELGVRWEQGVFIRSGAKLLDEKLVNESLRWLEGRRFLDVRLL